MNKFYTLVILIFCITFTAIGQVSISTDNTPPDQSAMLDVKSTTKGILAPRVALTAVNVASPISNPAIGLLVYNTIAAGAAPDNVVPGYYRWNGSKWILIEAPQGSNTGDMQYWNGSQWVLIPAGTYGQQMFFCNGIPTWGGCPPMLTTASVTNITYNSAVSGGYITLDGGSAIVTRGVCWSIHPNPTINDSITTNGNGTGSFVSNITGLFPNTLYHVRSYAKNSNLTGYGNDTSFTTLCEFYSTVNVSIEASTNPVCEGSIVSLQATPTNGGLLPVYQWKVNGVSVGTNNSFLMYTPTNNDSVQCFLTSSLPCTSSPAVSNTIIITVDPLLSVGVSIAASANNVCQGDTVTFIATGTNAGTISNYQWKLGGNIINGATNSIYSYVPANNDVITCVFTSNPPCTLSNSATSNSITMTVVSPPASPVAGTHIPSQTQIIWNWASVPGATGYKWNIANDYSTAIDMGTITTKTETGLNCNSAYTRYVWGYNTCENSIPVTLMTTTSSCSGGSFYCGQNITVSHVVNAVAPVNKTTTYGTVTNIPGEALKCWITSNLGSDHQATSVDDGTEASAGWYWQFNRKQGYKHDGTTRTPNTTWISNINETSDWITANDPCNIELGVTWRIPTYTEWYNINNSGGWTTWIDPWGSGLKLHAAGFLHSSNGSLYNRGAIGNYRSSTQYMNSTSWYLGFSSAISFLGGNSKSFAMCVRCVRDY